MSLYNQILEKKDKKQFVVLVDPDKPSIKETELIAKSAVDANVDLFFIGGSLLTTNNLDLCIKILKDNSDIPVILFPGNTMQLSSKADAILFLSLISGRNPEMLIGRHVISAPYIKLANLEVISTGYMLIDSGKPTAVSYMSSSVPIPADKDDIAACTAMAGEMLGMKVIYMDAGSGASEQISDSMISMVKQSIDIPLIIGGGIRTPEIAVKACKAGADIVVVGNAIEKESNLIKEISMAIHAI
ncbi:MAG: geranylgeranylglyceryl/heptaprenylglyceryl phosphate synthase [Saprospiraceae bacterium]|nr:geranylgeranylglyceryl/heptaprenylglyceryl phosphate synthase [Saprospiraceae bacterium]